MPRQIRPFQNFIFLFVCINSYLYSQQMSLTVDAGLNIPAGVNLNSDINFPLFDQIGLRIGYTNLYAAFPSEYLYLEDSFRTGIISISLFNYSGYVISESLIAGAGIGYNYIYDWSLVKRGYRVEGSADNGMCYHIYLSKNFILYQKLYLNLLLRLDYINNKFNYKSRYYSGPSNSSYTSYSKSREFYIVSIGIGLGMSFGD